MINYILVKEKHIPGVKVGDFLRETVHADAVTTLYNSRKVTKIHKNGTLRVECINPKCNKVNCTYLHLSEKEISKLKIDNTLTKSGRLGGITL